MNENSLNHQRGAVLLVALILLLVLTLLAITGVREATLESRITGNKAHALQLNNASEAALREAEFRFFNPASLRDKLEPKADNCSLDNKLKTNGANKPCLLPVKSDKNVIRAFVLSPLELTQDNQSKYMDSGWDALVWMPYRGRDAVTETEAQYPSNWNTYLISGGPADDTPMNVEYGASGEGRGTYFYLGNGSASDGTVTQGTQSTFANVYVGLNN